MITTSEMITDEDPFPFELVTIFDRVKQYVDRSKELHNKQPYLTAYQWAKWISNGVWRINEYQGDYARSLANDHRFLYALYKNGVDIKPPVNGADNNTPASWYEGMDEYNVSLLQDYDGHNYGR